ncbi:F0F1 ATP synthase subunit A [Perlabentimonas gracilis]|uniref:F0F1 ATP synthase subunit A n=1 Tax=Perlabentimonas gracilis TaxID=2715279 RepID=UPI001F35A603|nr:F0F1 ATP synthase subunit A [Perlabentimonas gracilis]
MKLGISFLSLMLWVHFLAFPAQPEEITKAIDRDEVHHAATDTSHSKEFNAGDFIFDHIGDAHDWHIVTIGDKHISVPLPIILYSRTRGQLFTFLSSKFHHGHDTYKGFKLVTDGDLKGKIAEVDVHNNISDGPLPLDFSIKKNVVGILFSIIILLLVFVPIAKKYKAAPHAAPTGIQSLMETLILFVRDDIAKPSIGEKHYLKFMPYLLTIFFFIWLNNLLGLIPIFPAGANVTGNIAVTMVLALATLATILLNANKSFWKHIVNTPGVPVFLKLPIPIMPIVEAASWLIKPAVLMIRLFANILAGHIIAMVLFSLIFIFGAANVYFGFGISFVTILLTVFMSVLELLVSFIQAFVFTMLSALFLGMATEEHH